MGLAKKYRKSQERRWVLRLKTKHPDGDNYDGVVKDIKRGFIVLREERDFEFDGIIVLPKRVITGYRDGRFETCINEIMRTNRKLKDATSPRWLASCATMGQVIAQLHKRDIWPAVEILTEDDTDSYLLLGPITHVTDKGFSILLYEADGTWEAEHEVQYDEIFKVEVDSRYTNTFNAFMKSKGMPA